MSRIEKAATRLGNLTPERFRRFDPLIDDYPDICQCFLVTRTVRHAAGQFGHLDEESPVVLTPPNH